MLIIKVISPDEKIVSGIPDVSLSNLYLQNEFVILVKNRNEVFKFEVNLPEWLLALTEFMKIQGHTNFDSQLLLSGEHFIAKREKTGNKIRIFDQNKLEIDWLHLTTSEIDVLHSRLVCELIDAVEQSAERPLQIRDLGRLEVG